MLVQDDYRLRLDKCKFLKELLEYLGFDLGDGCPWYTLEDPISF